MFSGTRTAIKRETKFRNHVVGSGEATRPTPRNDLAHLSYGLPTFGVGTAIVKGDGKRIGVDHLRVEEMCRRGEIEPIALGRLRGRTLELWVNPDGDGSLPAIPIPFCLTLLSLCDTFKARFTNYETPCEQPGCSGGRQPPTGVKEEIRTRQGRHRIMRRRACHQYSAVYRPHLHATSLHRDDNRGGRRRCSGQGQQTCSGTTTSAARAG